VSIKLTNISLLQDPPKFTQIGFEGLIIYHLATLVPTGTRDKRETIGPAEIEILVFGVLVCASEN
jgi:hypothetical protein